MYNEFLIDFEYVGKCINKFFIFMCFKEILSDFSKFNQITDE